jgi:hypothetical protein
MRKSMRQIEIMVDFASATLSNINLFAIIVQRRNHAYLRGFDVDLAAIAEGPDVYESV